MEDLSEKQGQVLKYLTDFNIKHRFPPTIRELCDHFGFKSLNTAHFHLRSLEKKGHIQIHPGKGRGITLPKARRLSKRKMPVVGRIAAGTPILALENIEEFLGIDNGFFGTEQSFAVQVRGDSMVDAHIQDGDYVIIKIQDQAQNGDIVAALIDDEVTLKYFYRPKNQIRLESANPKYPPLSSKRGIRNPLEYSGSWLGWLEENEPFSLCLLPYTLRQ